MCKAILLRCFLKGRLFITSTSIFLPRGVSGSRTRRSASRQLRHGRTSTRKERVVRKLLADSQTRVMRKKARAVGHARKAGFCLLVHAFSTRRHVVACYLPSEFRLSRWPSNNPNPQSRDSQLKGTEESALQSEKVKGILSSTVTWPQLVHGFLTADYG